MPPLNMRIKQNLDSICGSHSYIMTILLRFFILLVTILIQTEPTIAGKRLLPPAPPPMDKSAFFASERACVSSGAFSPRECADAFDRVETLLRERAPKFAKKSECVLQFHLCNKSEDAYRPAALGVEIVRSRKDLVALPMLAVDAAADMWSDPEPTPARMEALADRAPPSQESQRKAPSPYGALELQTSLTPSQPPTFKSYRRFVEAALLRPAGEQGQTPSLGWRAGR